MRIYYAALQSIVCVTFVNYDCKVTLHIDKELFEMPVKALHFKTGTGFASSIP
jgi:hypothetical protein